MLRELNPTLEKLKVIIADQFNREFSTLNPEMTLRGGLMLDSLDLVDLIFIIGVEFGVEMPVTDLHSLGNLVELIEHQLSSAA